MPEPTTTRHKVILSIATLNIVMAVLGIAAGVVYLFAFGTAEQLDEAVSVISFGLSAVFYSVLSVMILSRYPHHVVGWLFLPTGFLSALMVAGSSLDQWLGDVIVLSRNISRIGDLIWIPALFIPMTLVLQYFPNGRLPSRRWWPLPFITVLFFAYLGSSEFIDLGFLGSLDFILGTASIVGSLVAAIIHFRRAQGVERLQMKWLVYAAVVIITSTIVGSEILGDENPIVSALFVSTPSLLAIVMGFAILRYRLFDIDIIIRRTLIYGALTATLALVYFGSVVLLQQVVGRIAGVEQSTLAIVLSTLLIAALFSPLRRRLQDLIDRRFYRRRYDAEQVMATFARTARDETDMDRLTDGLLSAVKDTMQPTKASVYLLKRDEVSIGD